MWVGKIIGKTYDGRKISFSIIPYRCESWNIKGEIWRIESLEGQHTNFIIDKPFYKRSKFITSEGEVLELDPEDVDIKTFKYVILQDNEVFMC